MSASCFSLDWTADKMELPPRPSFQFFYLRLGHNRGFTDTEFVAEGIRIPSEGPVPPGPLVRDAAQAYIREHPQEVIAAVLDPESPALAPGPSLPEDPPPCPRLGSSSRMGGSLSSRTRPRTPPPASVGFLPPPPPLLPSSSSAVASIVF